MKLKLYDKNGYCDIPAIIDFALANNCHFIFITGGRGTGKTFGALMYCVKNKKQFMFVRRKQTQIDEISSDKKNPLNPVGKKLKRSFAVAKITKTNSAFYNGEYDDEKEKIMPSGDPIGYTACATTGANSRGFDASDVEVIIYDEFIPERTEKRIKGEAESTLNLFETVSRNREIEGGEPTINLLLANSMNIDNALYGYLGFVDIVDEMEQKRHSYRVLSERDALIINLYDSPISKRKSETSLYKLTRGTAFNEMALDNAYSFEERGNIRSLPLQEFALYAAIDRLSIYRHKSLNLFYVTTHKRGTTKEIYKRTEIDLLRFRTEHPEIWSAYVFNELVFDRYATEIKFRSLYS